VRARAEERRLLLDGAGGPEQSIALGGVRRRRDGRREPAGGTFDSVEGDDVESGFVQLGDELLGLMEERRRERPR